ncbi:unnamed protein product [Microthlaspi erraticum]|uniref:F-box associated beta-propeller type 3 domain-containing protein n=1 Tax=Microthlaspi erraticum TaxID=1685480 RepID=A0A6D2KI52_9BRAS|nr:unnamed protein product [Microthlaspi erraticum]
MEKVSTSAVATIVATSSELAVPHNLKLSKRFVCSAILGFNTVHAMETRRRQNVSEDLLTVSRSNTRSSTLANKGENSAETIPIDLIIEILLKLPVKSLARCRSILWDSIIRRPHFTELILNRSLARPRLLLAQVIEDDVFFFSSPQLQNPDENLSPVAATYHMKFQFYGGSRLFHNNVHGLVFLKYMEKGKKDEVMVICNPSTGQSLTPPKVKTTRIDVYSFLGYDPIDKQFKVLSMTCSLPERTTEQHQVLTLGGTGKLSWRMIECSLPHYPQSDGICINGVLYYKAKVYGVESNSGIVCFDIRSEKFELIPKFDFFTPWMLNYMGRLAILKWDDDFQMVTTMSFELCVLEDAKKHEWSTRTFVPPALWNEDVTLDVVGFTRRGEIVLSQCYSSNLLFLIYYNPERSTLTKVDIQGMDAFKHNKVHFFLDHVEDVKLGGVFRTV